MDVDILRDGRRYPAGCIHLGHRPTFPIGSPLFDIGVSRGGCFKPPIESVHVMKAIICIKYAPNQLKNRHKSKPYLEFFLATSLFFVTAIRPLRDFVKPFRRFFCSHLMDQIINIHLWRFLENILDHAASLSDCSFYNYFLLILFCSRLSTCDVR